MGTLPGIFDFLGEQFVAWEFPSHMDVLLDYLDWCLSTMEDLLEHNEHKVRKQYDEQEEPDVRQYLEEGVFVAEHLLPNLLRRSFFLAIYSLFEDSLRKRCLCVEREKASPVLLEDIAGSGYIDQYRKYLEKLGDVDVQGISEWKTFPLYGQLRNRVAHYQGYLNPRNTELMKFVEGNSFLDISYPETDSEPEIIFKRGFCEEAVATIKRFFQALDGQLPVECQDLEHHFGYRP